MKNAPSSMHALFIIDPIATLNLATETSLLLVEELARRGHRVSVATLPDLFLSDRDAGVRAQSISLELTRQPFYTLGAVTEHHFGDFDLVLMRKDPPVDADYINATFVLERAATVVPVINDPVSLRTVNEKILALGFPQFAPPTLVSNDARRLAAFAAVHGRIVLKPLGDCSGHGIEVLQAPDGERLAAYVVAHGGHYVMMQAFIPGVVRGDKRIFLLAGDPVGAVNRVPRSTEHLANIHQGARVEAATLTARDRAIIAAVQPLLVARGLWLAGIDVIDGYLTEINVTSPSAARQINAVSTAHIERTIVDWLEGHARKNVRRRT